MPTKNSSRKSTKRFREFRKIVTEQETPATDTPAVEHGRIGYGGYAKYSPLGLAILLIVVLVAIGIWQNRPESGKDQVGQLVGTPAPEFAMTLLDGSTLRLSNLRGSVVVVNFWAFWCAPCKEELPRLQTIANEANTTGQPLTIVGVGNKRDYDKSARDFVASLGLTFPIGRDTEGNDNLRGTIQLTYGVTNYPTTVFIRPDGTVSAVHIGEMTEDQIREYVAKSV